MRVVLTDQVFPDVARERAILAEVGAKVQVAEGSREDVLRYSEEPLTESQTKAATEVASALTGRQLRCRVD